VRIKSKFHNRKRPKSLEEIAGALAFIGWRIGQTTVNKMYSDGFNFHSNEQLLDVIGEFLAFTIQVTDRLVHERGMSDEERARFINTFALKLVDHMQDNREEEQGPGDYRGPFVEKLNERLGAYAEFNFENGQPGYQMLRYFGRCVDDVMGGQENKWVIEQVVEVEAPEVIKNLKKGLNDLLAQADSGEAADESSAAGGPATG